MTEQHWDPHGYHALAHELMAAGSEDESHLRAAISRAYYACLLLARAGLERSGRWSAGTVNMHERVIQELFARRRGNLASGLRVLRHIREHADYNVQVAFDRALAEEALRKADVLVRQLTGF